MTYLIFASSILPEAEMAASHRLSGALAQLDRFVDAYGHALDLFNSARDADLKQPRFERKPGMPVWEYMEAKKPIEAIKRKYSDWMRMAIRDSVMTIYHIKYTLDDINGYRKTCPTIFAHVERKKQKAAADIFERNFPDLFPVRNSVAHIAENMRASKIEKHMAEGPYEMPGVISVAEGAKGFMADNLDIANAKLIMTFEGKAYEAELSDAKVRALHDQLYSAFEDAANAIQQIARETRLRQRNG